jgi:RNA polymerase sigma-70 factor, ECF subfamily
MVKSESDWQQIVTELGPSLYRYFCGIHSAPTASDLVQETLIRLVQKFRNDEFDPSKGTLRAYAFGIARFVRLESLKDKTHFDLVDNESSLDIAAAEKINSTDAVTHLRWAITQLKPIEQELILSMIDNDLSLDSLASDFKIPVGTVKSHIHRAKEKLREIMR